MKTVENIEERIIEKERALTKTIRYLNNAKEENYDVDDLRGELDNIKADLRILRWVIND